MPAKFIRCVKKVMKEEEHKKMSEKVNPYAVCRVSTGYKGTSHNIGLLKPKNNYTIQDDLVKKELDDWLNE